MKSQKCNRLHNIRASLMVQALKYVATHGWSTHCFNQAIKNCNIEATVAHHACPRRGLDLAIFYHKTGDNEMMLRVQATDLSSIPIRDRIAFAVITRLEITDKIAAQKALQMFALPQNTALATQAFWGTADAIWNSLNDPSKDINWYSKRAILASVYAATLLYWLSDESNDNQPTKEFLTRRIEGVMQFEKLKSRLKTTRFGQELTQGLSPIFSCIKKPDLSYRNHLPARAVTIIITKFKGIDSGIKQKYCNLLRRHLA